MTDNEIKAPAAQIARDLFTCGRGQKESIQCDHLRLYQGEQYMGGWGEKPLADRVAKHLREAMAKKKEKVKE